MIWKFLIGCGLKCQLDCRILESTISQVRIGESACFWHADMDSGNVNDGL